MDILSAIKSDGGADLDRHPLVGPNIGPYMEKLTALGSVSGAVNIDLSLGNYFTMALTGATTLAFTNVPAARSGSRIIPVTLRIYMDSVQTVTWPSGTAWGAAGEPTFVAGNNIFALWLDGTTWFAVTSWQP